MGRSEETPFSARSRSRSLRTPGGEPSHHSVIERFSPAATAWNAGAVSASRIRCAAPLTSRQCASPDPVSWLLISAVATPTLDSPYQTATYSSRLGANSATVSPRLIPRPVAQCA